MAKRVESKLRVHRVLLFLLVALCMIGGSRRALAQEQKSAAFESTQFLVIVDDSGSMRVDTKYRGQTYPKTDPNRLAVMSARLFGYLLGPDDKVLVVGLNELASLQGDRAPLTSKQAVEPATLSRLDANGIKPALAAYQGENDTPCQSALASARRLLNTWHAANGRKAATRQAVLLLTDGACEPDKEAPEDATQWLNGVASRKDNPAAFRFYVLRFEGRPWSESLGEYATKTTGAAPFSVKSASDVQGLVQAFVGVITEAKGYPALAADGKTHRSFARARDVRVLAIRLANASGSLDTKVVAESGQPPKKETVIKGTFHRTVDPGLEKYEYLVETIHPNGTRFYVEPANGSFAILVPDYRQLQAEVSVVPGACTDLKKRDPEARGHSTFLSGGSLGCIQVALTVPDPAQQGKTLRLTRADDLDFEAFYDVSTAGENLWKSWRGLAPKEQDCGIADYRADRDGMFELKGKAQVKDAKSPLESALRPLSVGTVTWEPTAVQGGVKADAIRLGTVRAGEKKTFTVKFEGFFPGDRPLKVHFDGPLANHPCLLELRAPDGTAILPVSPRQSRDFELATKPRCPDGGGMLAGRLWFASEGLESKAIPVEMTFVPTPWFEVWGPKIAAALAALFTLITLWCVVNGFRVPQKKLPQGKKNRMLFYASDAAYLKKRDADFCPPPNTKMGAYLLDAHICGGGWYRNGAIPLGRPECKLPAPPAAVDLEVQEGGKFLLVARGKALPDVYEVPDPNRVGPKLQGLSKLEFAKPAATLARSVGPICRVYARLLGRLPAVQSVKIDEEGWYALSVPGEEKPAYYFKVDVQPS